MADRQGVPFVEAEIDRFDVRHDTPQKTRYLMLHVKNRSRQAPKTTDDLATIFKVQSSRYFRKPGINGGNLLGPHVARDRKPCSAQICDCNIVRPRSTFAAGDHQHPKNRVALVHIRYSDHQGRTSSYDRPVGVRECYLGNIPNLESTALPHRSRPSQFGEGSFVLFSIPFPERCQRIL